MESDEIRKKLFELQNVKYKEFHSTLSPDVEDIIGVKIPVLRSFAKELYKNNNLENIKIGNKYQEEILLSGMLIGFQTKEKIEEIIKQIEEHVPKINSWVTCDIFCSGLKITKKYPKEIFAVVERYLKSKKEFEIRFSLVMLLDYYINDEYIDKVLNILGNIKLDKYYVQMANAWAISVALVKYYDKTIKFLNNSTLDDFTYNKGIQKAIESYRITDEQKDYLRRIKRK